MSDKKGGSLSHFVAGVVGAAFGVAAVLLSKKENRDKLKKQIDGLKKAGGEKLTDVKKKLEEIETMGTKELSNKLDVAKKKLDQRTKKLIKK